MRGQGRLISYQVINNSVGGSGGGGRAKNVSNIQTTTLKTVSIEKIIYYGIYTCSCGLITRTRYKKYPFKTTIRKENAFN